jgi:hypothetical protein
MVAPVPTPVILALVASLALQGSGATMQELLPRAKELYSTAAYDDALAMLDSLAERANGTLDIEVAKYRAFCLFALQRTDEARKVIEDMVSAEPFYRILDAQASPRVYKFFEEIRRAALPATVRRLYQDARAALDRKDPGAPDQFDRVLALLNDADMQDESTADFRSLVTGFRDLSRAAAPASQPPEQAPVAADITLPARAASFEASLPRPRAPVVTPEPSTSSPASRQAADEEAAIASALRAYEHAYSTLDIDGVIAVFPSVNVALLAQGFTQMKAQRVQILGARFLVSGNTATVTCQVRQRFEPKAGRPSETTVNATFRLQKTGVSAASSCGVCAGLGALPPGHGPFRRTVSDAGGTHAWHRQHGHRRVPGHGSAVRDDTGEAEAIDRVYERPGIAHVVDDLARRHEIEAPTFAGPRLGLELAGDDRGIRQPPPRSRDGRRGHVERRVRVTEPGEHLALVPFATPDLEQRVDVRRDVLDDDAVGFDEAKPLGRRVHVPWVAEFVGQVEAAVGVGL